VIEQIAYPGYTFRLAYKGEVPYLQIVCTALCNVQQVPVHWRSRKWMLSEHMTDGEIVQTALKAVLTALEHEAREKFTYRRAAIFDPHYDIDRLVELRVSSGALKERA